MKIYYVRHGYTRWNLDGLTQGHSDVPLCDEGREQAKEAAKMLADKHIDLCIASPLMRTRETAEIILAGRDVPVIYDERIKERCFGYYEGKPYFKNETEEFKTNLWRITEDGNFGDVETMASVKERVYGFLDEIKEKYKDKSILLVSHGGLSPAVKYYIAGEEFSENYRFDIIRNCQIIEGEI